MGIKSLSVHMSTYRSYRVVMLFDDDEADEDIVNEIPYQMKKKVTRPKRIVNQFQASTGKTKKSH